MTLSQILGKTARLPAVVRDGWRYPALRLQAQPGQTPVDALAGLGFDGAELRRYDQDFGRLAPALYAELARTARAADGPEGTIAADRASQPSAAAHECKRLIYLAVRARRPRVVAETGTYNGAASAFLLRALHDNGSGRLVSFDVPAPADALGVGIPPGRSPGWLVPDALRSRFEVVPGDTRRTLAARLEQVGPVEVFLHDSLHTARHMRFEYRAAWRHLRSGGVLMSDDVFWNLAFWRFTKRHRVPLRHTAGMGLTRKP